MYVTKGSTKSLLDTIIFKTLINVERLNSFNQKIVIINEFRSQLNYHHLYYHLLLPIDYHISSKVGMVVQGTVATTHLVTPRKFDPHVRCRLQRTWSTGIHRKGTTGPVRSVLTRGTTHVH